MLDHILGEAIDVNIYVSISPYKARILLLRLLDLEIQYLRRILDNQQFQDWILEDSTQRLRTHNDLLLLDRQFIIKSSKIPLDVL